MSFYELRVVTRTGAIVQTFQVAWGGGTSEMASIDEVSWVLNEPGVCRFRVPLFHPASLALQALKREVQVWRNGVIIFWGVLGQRTIEGAEAVWTCPGLLWYFSRRVFGPIGVNYLTNPRFATNLTGWTAVGATATHSTALRIRGPGTARLVATSSGDNYLQQTFQVSTGSIGLYLAVAAWYWIDPATTFTATALEERGLYVQAANALPDATPKWEPITMNAPRGELERVETGIQLAANLTNETVTVRFYAPHAAIHWGAGSVTALESVSSEPEGTDIALMMGRIVEYVHEAFDYNIGWSTPAAGVKEILAYQFADLGNVFSALRTYPGRGLADFEIAITATAAAGGSGTRVFTSYAPKKGTLKAAYGVTVPGPATIQLRHDLDGEPTATRNIWRGAGDGSDRELGVAIDAADLDGLILDHVDDAPPEITVDGLDGFATTDLAQRKDVVANPEAEVPAAAYLGNVGLGDTIPWTIDWGVVQETADRRITRMSLRPQRDMLVLAVDAA